CLVTDWKQNMDSLFVPDEEVVVYKTPQECADKVQYLLNNPDKMHAIALAGQRRTLNDYTYEKRLADMIPVLLM
ncbi:MAG: glycosyltransferase, partial [Bacteroidota bacterium]